MFEEFQDRRNILKENGKRRIQFVGDRRNGLQKG